MDTNETLNASLEVQLHDLSEFPSDSITLFKKLRINLITLQVDCE